MKTKTKSSISCTRILATENQDLWGLDPFEEGHTGFSHAAVHHPGHHNHFHFQSRFRSRIAIANSMWSLPVADSIISVSR